MTIVRELFHTLTLGLWRTSSTEGFLTAYRRAARPLVADSLPEQHRRALLPFLNDNEIHRLKVLTDVWLELEVAAKEEYVAAVHDDPARGDLHFQRYRQATDRIAQSYRERTRSILKYSADAGSVALPLEEVEGLYDLATRYKDWTVRRGVAQYRDEASSVTPLRRAEWFFVEYMYTWERPQA